MYKAVFFDLDGTLRHTVPLGAEVYREKIAEFGMPVSDEAHRESCRWEHYYWANSPELRRDTARFSGGDDSFWENYATVRLGKMGATPEQIKAFRPKIRQYIKEKYHPKDWVPPELHQILPALRADGFKLAVLSNRRTPFEDLLKELSLFSYFDKVMAAGEIGAWKPNPKIFTPLLEKFALKPEETLYIGDNYYADVVGARNAGITPLLYDPRDIFPDADCARITSFEQLGAFLEA